MDEKVRKALEKFGQVKEEDGLIEVTNEGKPSFQINIQESQVKVFPCFGPGVKPEVWWHLAENNALVIREAILGVL